MIVHTDDTRHDRVPAQVEYRGTFARGLICTVEYPGYLAVLNVEVLIPTRWRARAIDDLHMFKNHFRRGDLEVLAHLRPESIQALRFGELPAAQRQYAKTQYCQRRAKLNWFHEGTPFFDRAQNRWCPSNVIC